MQVAQLDLAVKIVPLLISLHMAVVVAWEETLELAERVALLLAPTVVRVEVNAEVLARFLRHIRVLALTVKEIQEVLIVYQLKGVEVEVLDQQALLVTMLHMEVKAVWD